MFLDSVFSFFARNPIAQGLAAAFAFVLVWKANNWHQRREGEAREKIRQRERDAELREEAREVATEIIEQEKSDADDARSAGILAGRSEPNDLERMPDAEWQLTFGRPRAAGDPGYGS